MHSNSRRYRRSSVDDLSPELRLELKTRLRAAAYGPLDEFVEWLADSGHQVSRSSLGRWVKTLREGDAAIGIDPELRTPLANKLIDLWERLEALRAEERNLLEQIRLATLSSAQTAAA